jgi:hypothetical protein
MAFLWKTVNRVRCSHEGTGSDLISNPEAGPTAKACPEYFAELASGFRPAHFVLQRETA